MAKKIKKQRQLVDFPPLRKQSCEAATNEVIVLDDDEEDLALLQEVQCPVCCVNLLSIQIDQRVRHVNLCLVRVSDATKKEEADSLQADPLGSKDAKSKRALGAAQVERSKYVNSAPKKRKVKQEERPKHPESARDLLPSKKKKDIPELKIMRFHASPAQKYCVSVDAFNYKPHELIKQYFLSHFHSDHYGGISKRWSLERTIDSKIIYCSRITARLLQIRFNIDPRFIFDMEDEFRYKVRSYVDGELQGGGYVSEEQSAGLYVTLIDANHCPGAVIFLFESIPHEGDPTYYLHCGDFRIDAKMLNNPLLKPFHLGGPKRLAKVYLDTTYMNPNYNFPKQKQVCESIANLIYDIVKGKEMVKECFGTSIQSRINQFLPLKSKGEVKKCLVLVGTYLIGKERIATSILKILGGCPIYVSPINSRDDKAELVRAFQDQYLDSVLTADPLGPGGHEVVVHLVPMKIVGTLKEMTNYLNFNKYHDSFERCVGLRPSGWTFQDNGADYADEERTEEVAGSMIMTSPAPVHESLTTLSLLKHSKDYTSKDILKQNPFTAKKYANFDPSTSRIFTLPYSEHLSFRELCFLVVFFDIGQVIPTVNMNNPESAKRILQSISDWQLLRKRLISTEMNLWPVSLADF